MSRDPRFTTHPRTTSERERELELLLEEDPDNETLLKGLAFARYSNHRFKEAAEIYVRLLPGSQDSAVHFYAANTFFRLGDLRAAIGAWQKAVSHDQAGIYTERATQRIEMAGSQLGKADRES